MLTHQKVLHQSNVQDENRKSALDEASWLSKWSREVSVEAKCGAFESFSASQLTKSSFSVKLSFPQRGTREDFIYNGTFHEAVSFILATAQLFGIMPVSGVRGKLPKNVKFRKFSFRFIWTLILTTGCSWVAAMDVYWIYTTRLEFGKLINFLFNATNLLSLFCFLELAIKWPRLITKWNEVEKFLPQLKYQFDKQKMAYEIKMASFAILFISMGEKFAVNPLATTFKVP